MALLQIVNVKCFPFGLICRANRSWSAQKKRPSVSALRAPNTQPHKPNLWGPSFLNYRYLHPTNSTQHKIHTQNHPTLFREHLHDNYVHDIVSLLTQGLPVGHKSTGIGGKMFQEGAYPAFSKDSVQVRPVTD